MKGKQKSKKKNIDQKEFWVKKPNFTYRHPAIITIFKFIIMCCLISGIVYIAICAKTILKCDELKISKDDLIIKYENSTVYDIDGNYLATLSSGTKRKCVSLDEMSEYLPKAYIAIEDERFYEHFGVDVKRTVAATMSYIIHMGKSDFGGSTITQQVVKNITEDKEDSANRKVKEMAKAIQVEKYLDKNQILELYLNIIFVGGNDINGVELGAKYYFNKTAKDLSIAECAFMAGINHAPNGYKPFSSDPKMIEKIKTRTKTVLAKMYELQYITEEQYNQSIAETDKGLNFQKGDTNPTTIISYQTEAALRQIIKQIMEEKGVNKQMAEMILYSGGYKIYTTQKTPIQQIVEDELVNQKYLIFSGSQSSMATFVVIDHKTGEVLSCGTGIGEDKKSTNIGNFNYPLDLKKQTGSCMKPISVIAPGLENKVITGATVFYDGQTNFGNYSPKNYYVGYKGPMTMRQAIALSANIPNVKALAKLGVDKSMSFCESVGITGLGSEGLSLALGGLENGTSALNMAAAYAAIANNGVYIEPTFYTKVVDQDGTIYVQCKTPEERSKRVLSEQNAYITQNILQSVVQTGGTATYCSIPGIEVGAKTGTTNGDKDRWLCGFTPYYTAACWFGYEKGAQVFYNGNPAGLIWSSIMKKIHTGLENKTFTEPAGIVRANICRTTGHTASAGCSDVYVEVFAEGTVPSPCDGHRFYTICNDSGLLAKPGCTNVSSLSYPKILDSEQNAPWTTLGYGTSGNAPSETCNINHSVPQPAPETTGETIQQSPTPDQPAQPAQPAQPTQPAQPATPAQPTQPTAPAESTVTEKPTTPPATEKPVNSTTPAVTQQPSASTQTNTASGATTP